MSNYLFHNEGTLAEKAEELGKKAVQLGLIPSFVVYYYPDSQEFCLPNENNSMLLTAPEAYMKFKKLVESALSQV